LIKRMELIIDHKYLDFAFFQRSQLHTFSENL